MPGDTGCITVSMRDRRRASPARPRMPAWKALAKRLNAGARRSSSPNSETHPSRARLRPRAQPPADHLGGRDAHRCADALKENARGLFLQMNWGNEPAVEPNKASETLATQVKDPLRVQQDRRDRWKQQVAGAKTLHDRQVGFAFSSEGLQEPADFFKGVRQAIGAGLPRQVALGAITRNAAGLMGLDHRLGTLSVGKLAHVVALNGPFDDERSKVRLVFVDGLRFEYNKNAEPVSGPAAGPTELAGTWQMEIEAADGRFNATLDLKQSGPEPLGSVPQPAGGGEGLVRQGQRGGRRLRRCDRSRRADHRAEVLGLVGGG